MITKDNLKNLLLALKFEQNGNQYSKIFAHSEAVLTVDFDKNCLIYPEDQGLTIHERQTCNFSANENFVVFECVHRLLEKGYKPEHIELEPKWKVGHGASGGRADILVKDNQGNPLLIIECKTPGNEYNKAWKNTELHGDQLFSYAQQIPDTQFLCLYTADYTETGGVSKLSHIISHKDNPKVLDEGKNLKAFKDGGDSKNRFTVWRDTYKKEYTTQGIFEPNIQPYFIGKDKYTQDDLNSIDAKDKEGKYHKFRTILRKHNVSGRENAFDVLVNLFLCKIVDESENTTELKFYWKGIAYDSYFDLIDRLQALYKIGMGRYLDQDIVYISNDQIENAFWAVKQKRNATKNTIKDYFRQLKFFTNNDFGFIDVHNEALFYQNAKVLLEVVQMWQDLRLKDQEQNQFLGDMFEYFLDQGIKQSEGQFFTPMPICKFILMSLPLETIIKDSIQAPKAIDYACGAGHFLNELAAQLKPFIKQYKQTDPKAFFQEIIGIEKEYRLSKVAKVAAFMYGQEGIEILHHDALDQHPKVQKGSFNILVANPPFAVEGFLETLPEEQRDQYALKQTVTDVANNRNIQCFFIERAQQLLERGGVAGIIVPSSVLSNSDSTHIGSREILLQAFDIVALVELGNGTFGKTGTNTVVLFIRRKRQLPEPAEHFKNRVEDWFENDNDEDMETYQDLHLIKKYCQHIAIPFEHYQTLLHGTPSADLLAHELFLDYKKDFDQSSDIKKLCTQKFFKDYSAAQKQTELKKRWLVYLLKIEKDKLFYFVLAYNNPQKVLIVKSPSDNKEQKQFLGYEWSAAKGNEGLKMTTTAQGNHLTPLYDPEDRYNPEKINALIQDNFSGNAVVIPETLQTYTSLVSLVDLLDFSRKDFDKHINLSVKKNVSIDSKWESVKIANLNTLLKRGKSTKYGNSNIQVIKSGQARGRKEFNFTEKYFTTDNFQSDERNLQKGDLLINSTGVGTAGRVTLFELEGNFVADSHITIFRPNEKILSEYALQCFAHIGFKTIERMAQGLSGQIELTIPTISEIQIPVPPLETQTQIVQACEAIDAEVMRAQCDIENAAKELEKIKTDIFSRGFIEKKLSECSLINPSKTEIKQVDENTLISFVEMASVNEAGFINRKEDRLLKDLKKGSYTYFKENDIIIAKITPCMENGKCAFATDLTNGLAMGSSEFHVIRANEAVVLGKYIFALLNRESVRKEAEKKHDRLKRTPSSTGLFLCGLSHPNSRYCYSATTHQRNRIPRNHHHRRTTNNRRSSQ
jgi:type I restriction-modification system DNA methylase subunit/restriction endonuclease S subunit